MESESAFRLIPFTQKFWDGNKGETGPPDLAADPHLKNKLRPELPGIVRWLVDGCREWQLHGLGQPQEVTAEYRDAMDVLAQFLVECCIVDPGYTAKASDVRHRYEQWCKENGERPVSGRRFGDYLAEQGVEKRRSDGIWYSGLGLIA